MQDQRNQNPLAITGTPTLTAGALTLDTNQALTFNGPTSFASAADSPSLSLTGSMSLEFFLKFASLPGATRDVVSKASSYAAQLNTSGKLLFKVDNGASTVTVTSNATLSTGTWYHIVCVLNQEYAGAQQFGKTTAGAANMTLGDATNNKVVSKFALPEAGILNTITAQLQYFDQTRTVDTRAIVYADDGSSPSALVTMSESYTLTLDQVDWRSYSSIAFVLTPVLVSSGNYNLGLITDTLGAADIAVLQCGIDTSGGDLCKATDSVSSPSDPFGTPTVTNDDIMAIYCDYTAVARTGLEGTAAVYINGAFDNSAAYTAGIADNANALQISPSAALSVDEVSVWNEPLTPLRVATHYLAR